MKRKETRPTMERKNGLGAKKLRLERIVTERDRLFFSLVENEIDFWKGNPSKKKSLFRIIARKSKRPRNSS